MKHIINGKHFSVYYHDMLMSDSNKFTPDRFIYTAAFSLPDYLADYDLTEEQFNAYYGPKFDFGNEMSDELDSSDIDIADFFMVQAFTLEQMEKWCRDHVATNETAYGFYYIVIDDVDHADTDSASSAELGGFTDNAGEYWGPEYFSNKRGFWYLPDERFYVPKTYSDDENGYNQRWEDWCESTCNADFDLDKIAEYVRYADFAYDDYVWDTAACLYDEDGLEVSAIRFSRTGNYIYYYDSENYVYHYDDAIKPIIFEMLRKMWAVANAEFVEED